MHQLQNSKTDRKAHFISGTNSYIFWQEGAILRDFIKSTGL